MTRRATGPVAVARALVDARLHRRTLEEFPAAGLADLDEAYAIQREAIALWPDSIAGWKVGRLSDDLAQRFGVDRFIGPVFTNSVSRVAIEGRCSFAMYATGSAAFEAEYVVFVGRNGAGEIVPESVTTGIEVASSPCALLPELGSLASIADFGNNAGEIIGKPVPLDRLGSPESLLCTTRIGQAVPLANSAASLPGGPLAAFTFAGGEAERLGFPLRPGQFVSTGAVTGMHAVTPGQVCMADFEEFGRIECIVTAHEFGRRSGVLG